MNSVLQGLSAGLAAAAASIGTAYLLRSVRPVARTEGARMVVEYGRTMKIFASASWLLVGALFLLAVFSLPRDRIFSICTVLAFFLMVLYLHLEFFHVSIGYDSDGMHLASPWRRNRFVPWSAITAIRFSVVPQWYVLSTTDLGFVRLPVYLSGLQSLLDELASRSFSIPSATPIRSGPDSQPVSPHDFRCSDWQLLVWSWIAFFLALHGWATMHFSWHRGIAAFAFSGGCIMYPTLLYITVRTATERRVTARLCFSLVASLASFLLWLRHFYLVIYPQ